MAEQEPATRLRIVIVSGLSGAGKTIALRALEDTGFFCIDNLPVTLIDSFLSTISEDRHYERVGIGVDIREKRYLANAYDIIQRLKRRLSIEILFLEADSDVMIRRFKETRRPHPMLAGVSGVTIEEAIEDEKRQLAVIRDLADRIIDTSMTTPHQLRQQLMTEYGGEGLRAMRVTVLTFGYKFGVPQNADILFDVRFLTNPYFVPELKPLTGLQQQVSDFVLASEGAAALIAKLEDLLDFLMPRYVAEGRSCLVIGIGCTGGRHRSPVIARVLADYLAGRHRLDIEVIHRDISH